MNQKYKSLYWLRFVGVILIVYDHIGPMRNPTWKVSELVDRYFSQPLNIIQNFGGFGVCLFFIISGFLLKSSLDSRFKYIKRKFIRVIGTLLIFTFVFFCFITACSFLGKPNYWNQFSAKDWIEATTLYCYVIGNDNGINGAVWYLFPLFCLYIINFIFFNTSKKNNFIIAFIIDFIFMVLIFCYPITSSWPFMQYLVFLLVPVFGILTRELIDRKIGVKIFIFSTFLTYLLFIKSIQIFRPEYYIEQPYAISLIYALLIFIILILIEKKVCVPKCVEYISNISFSIYLTHMTFGSWLITIFEQHVPFTVAVIITFIWIVIVSDLHYRYIEMKLLKIK